MAIAKSTQTAQEALHHFKSFLGKPRTALPWLNGKEKHFPNRVHGFYDCALGYCYISGLRPIMTMCHSIRDYAKANKTWHRNIKLVQPGDAVLFDWSGKATDTDHVGMVDHVDVKRGLVTYVSADTGKVIPGIVTVNTVGMKWITGFARVVQFADPHSIVPTVSQQKREVHSATVAAPAAVPATAPALVTETIAHSDAAPVTVAPASTPVVKPATSAAAVAPAAVKAPPAKPVYREPFAKGLRNDEFGNMAPYRSHPHRGQDWSPKDQSPIPAICDGVVNNVFWTDVLGWVVEIKNPLDGVYTQYCHLAPTNPKAPKTGSSATVKKGDRVKMGQIIGKVGGSKVTSPSGSASTGAHLHMGMCKKPNGHLAPYNQLIDPLKWILAHPAK